MFIGLPSLGLRSSGGFTPQQLFAASEPGFHAETYDPQALLARRNWLTYSEDYSNAAWTKDGTTYAAGTLTNTATAAVHRVYQDFGSAFQGSRSIEAAAGTASYMTLSPVGNTTIYGAFDLSAGTVVGSAGCTASIAATSGGYYLCKIEGAGVVGQYHIINIAETLAQATPSSLYTGTGKTILLRGSQFDRNSVTTTAYQKVTDWNTEYLAAAGSANVGMWQDSAGTTPVTAVEQPVGKWMDWKNGKGAAGNHATQATAGSRPTLSARYNLLTKTEQFDDATWAKTNVTVDPNSGGTTDPLGGAGADKVIATAVNGSHAVGQACTLVAPGVFVVYAKAAEYGSITLGNAANQYVHFNLANGTVSTLGAGWTSATATAVGNGWYRCVATSSAVTWGTAYVYVKNVFEASGAGITAYTGDGASGVYLWGADLRSANDAALNQPAYQRVNTATDYDSTGFIHYLKFDGTDDSLQTPSIDFSGVNKMSVWAGATKLSDAATAIMTELTLGATSTDGGFYIAAPSGAAAVNFQFLTRGTVGAANTSATTYTAPISSVLTMALDNSAGTVAAQVIPRINGATPGTLAPSGTPTTTGNFANAPLNIGRRNNASLPFNGRLTSFTVRGTTTATTSGLVSAMEQYAARLAGQSFVST